MKELIDQIYQSKGTLSGSILITNKKLGIVGEIYLQLERTEIPLEIITSGSI